MISQRAIDLIVSCEVSSKAVYEKLYQRPEWPGGRSGVTVGIGYDLGYSTVNTIRSDWEGLLPPTMVTVMESCAGIRGNEASRLLHSVRSSISIPWDTAKTVFMDTDIPKYTKEVTNAIPLAAGLSSDCLGALVSLAYNRGASFNASGDRYREMRQIKAHINNGNLQAVASDIREMKRLWPDMKGLRDRREAEAKLWEHGLKVNTLPLVKPTVQPDPPPVLPPAPAGLPETSAAGATTVATAAVAGTTAQSGVSPSTVVLIIVGGILVAALLVWLVRKYRQSTPSVARMKDQP